MIERSVRHDRPPVVRVLPAEVVDVVERDGALRGVGAVGLHHLVGDAAHLAAEGGHEHVAARQQVQVAQQPAQRLRRVAAVRGRRLRHARVAQDRVQGVLLARLF